MQTSQQQRPALALLCAAIFIASMIALMVFDPFGRANLWVVLSICIATTAWGVRQRLRSRDEVLSEAFKVATVIGAPTAIIIAILVTAFASRIDGFREWLLYSWPETTNDPRMVGFGLGVSFCAILFTLCTGLARLGWWLAKR